ncbi:MAG: hypothetical protein FRX49_01406 [Trebouxia sp. A1-2]|nr:MAG: hypothetical protein FRX49_01406 [Trebouxia sp. A1-2]
MTADSFALAWWRKVASNLGLSILVQATGFAKSVHVDIFMVMSPSSSLHKKREKKSDKKREKKSDKKRKKKSDKKKEQTTDKREKMRGGEEQQGRRGEIVR